MQGDLLTAALAYADKGWAVFPLRPGGKEPLTEHGFKDATTDPETITRWWARWPSANIGFDIASRSADSDEGDGQTALLVIDVDPRNGGRIPEKLPPTLTCLTGGGGYHFYYTYNPKDARLPFRRTLQEGVDIKSAGGYAVLPPSRTESGYAWDRASDVLPAPCPDWLLKACQKPPIENLTPVTGGVVDYPTDTRPGSVFNRTASWHEILEPHGWVPVYRDGDEVFWRRPGKSEGISATTNYNETNLLYVFTSSTEFEAGTAYTPFAGYAVLEHNGDFSAAAASLTTKQLISTANLVKKEEYHFEHNYPADHFISEYIEYASKQTDAPYEYHEAAACILLALVTPNCRAILAPYPGGLSTNLYLSLVGATTRSRKSTAQKIANDIAKAVTPSSLLPNRATPEALIKSLSSKSGIATVWMPDEFGVSLAEMYNRDYLKSLEELLLTLYGGDDYVYERSTDVLTIRKPHLSLLAAATPESLSRAGAIAAESGLLPRFGVVYPATLPEPKVVSVSPEGLSTERAHLVSRLQQIIQWSNTHREITFDTEALEVLNEAELRLVNSTGGARLPSMLYKVAVLAAVGDRGSGYHGTDGPSGVPTVCRRSAESAIGTVERWRQGMERLTPLLYKGGTDTAFEKQMEFALTVLGQHNGVAARTAIAKALSTTKGKLDTIEQTLLDRGDITMTLEGGGKIWRMR